jgi:hypothetical protein
MKFLDLTDPFFESVGVRITVVGVTAIWGLFELSTGSVFWAMFFLGLSAICGWRFATIDYAALSEARQKAEQDKG